VNQLIFEPLEHAQAGNAEILAEIVVDGASGNAYFARPQNCEASPKAITTALQETECGLKYPYSANGDCVPMPQRDVPETVVPGGSLCTSGRQYPIGRLTVVASIFLLALFVGIVYRQDLRTAAAQTRGAISLATASIPPHFVVRKAQRVATFVATERFSATGSEPSVPGAVMPNGVTGTTTSVAPTSVGQSSHSVKARQPEAMFAGTTAVTVQSGDVLRQICLRQLGGYTEEVLRKIRELNPELSNPDRITVGQRILLPPSSFSGTNVVRPKQ
jgi:hypothetical protein